VSFFRVYLFKANGKLQPHSSILIIYWLSVM